MVDFSRIQTFSARDRVNLVTIDSLGDPRTDAPPAWCPPDFTALLTRVRAARENRRPVILSMGAHVIKSGLSRYLIALMREGYVTHIASNGAGSIHDFELA